MVSTNIETRVVYLFRCRCVIEPWHYSNANDNKFVSLVILDLCMRWYSACALCGCIPSGICIWKKNRILFAPCYRSNTGFINNDSLHSAVPFPKISHTHFSYFKCKRGVMWCVEDIRCMIWNSTACICFTSFGNIEKWDGLHILFYYFNPPLSRCCCWCWTLSFVNGLWKKLK